MAYLGYVAGPADGVIGRSTRTAIRQFQADNSLDATGRLDKQTIDKLYGRAKQQPTETTIIEPVEVVAVVKKPEKDAITIKIERLNKLRLEGAITEEEFILLKEKALKDYLEKE